MKRFVLLLAFILVPAVACAEWVSEPVPWLITRQGGLTGSSIVTKDTTWNVVAAGQTDTLWITRFTPGDVMPRGAGNPAGLAQGVINSTSGSGSDTTTVAWIVIQADSSAAITPTLSSMTVLIDGRLTPQRNSSVNPNSGWVKADSALVNGAAGGTLIVGNECVGVPIRTISPYGSIFRFQELRARITSATGVLTAARAIIRYWKN